MMHFACTGAECPFKDLDEDKRLLEIPPIAVRFQDRNITTALISDLEILAVMI